MSQLGIALLLPVLSIGNFDKDCRASLTISLLSIALRMLNTYIGTNFHPALHVSPKHNGKRRYSYMENCDRAALRPKPGVSLENLSQSASEQISLEPIRHHHIHVCLDILILLQIQHYSVTRNFFSFGLQSVPPCGGSGLPSPTAREGGLPRTGHQNRRSKSALIC